MKINALIHSSAQFIFQLNSMPHSWRHECACKALLDWYSDKQHALSLKNTLLESSPQATTSPTFPCPWSCTSSSQVQLHPNNQTLGNSNSLLIWTKSDSFGFTSYIYCKFNLHKSNHRSQQCFVTPFLSISPNYSSHGKQFHACLSEIQSPNFCFACSGQHVLLDQCVVSYSCTLNHTIPTVIAHLVVATVSACGYQSTRMHWVF